MSGVLRLLWPFTRGRRGAFAGGIAGTLLVTAAELARPFPLKIVVDQLLAAGSATGVEAGLVAAVTALVIAIAAAGAAGTYLTDAGMRRAGEHVVHDLRVALYAHLHRLSLRFHHSRQPGDLVTRLTGDVHAVGELVGESLVKVAGAVLLLGGMLVVSLALDPLLTLAAIAVTPVLAFATIVSRRAVKTAARRQRAAEGAIAALSTEALTGIATVKALGSESAEQERLRRRSAERRDAGLAGSATEGRFAGIVDVVEAIGTALVLGLGVLRVSTGALTPGELIVMHSYMRRLYRPLKDLARQGGRTARAMARAERVADVLRADDMLPDKPGAYAGARAAGHVELRDVRFAYDGHRVALRGISLVVPAGTRLAIVGPSGAGKSTLASLLARFHDPDRGAIRLDGRDLRDCSLTWLRDQVGFVLQDTALFSGTVADNISYGVDAPLDQIVAAARVAGAHEFIAALPDGYDTDLGAAGTRLSGGQRQRLSIARALLRDPAVVVLDEPTSGLDVDNEQSVIDALERLLRGRTTVLITHSLRLARRADRVVVLDRGRIAEDGHPDTLLHDAGPFQRLAIAQGVMSAPRLHAPADPALPQLRAILDPDAVADVLARQLADTDTVRTVTIRYVRYKPGTNVVADYEVTTSRGTQRAVLMAAADRNLAKRAADERNVRLAAKVADHDVAPYPLGYAPDPGVLVQWLPLDLWLPTLAERASTLAAGAGVTIDADTPAELVAYKPRRRGVLQANGHVLKLYADEAAFRLAANALLAGPRLPIPTAEPTGIDPCRHVTAQRALSATPIPDPVAVAAEAGTLLAEFHDAPTTRQRRLDPLAGAKASATTIAALVPDLRDRTTRLVRRLASSPPAGGPALCHGDFHSRQLVSTPRGLAVLDLDEMGIGAPALDPATYAAHLLDGTPAGLHRSQQALDALLTGYAARPDGLDWHVAAAVLRRAVFPFRTHPGPHWPDQVEAMLTTAERALPA
jgi:ABC-type multidrug transport system fused ATPase/permease subunit